LGKAWLDTVAIAISVLALLVSGGQLLYSRYQGQYLAPQVKDAEQHSTQAQAQLNDTQAQFKTSLRPLVTFDTENDPDGKSFGLAIANRGTGPAVIRSLTYYVDRVPFAVLKDAIAAGHVKSGETEYLTFDGGDVLGVGDREWLVFRRKKSGGDKAEAERFEDFLANRFAVGVSYCSLAEECFTICSKPSRC